jgi:hypothetical protein
MRSQGMPRLRATASSSASSVNGEGSLSEVERSPMGMPSRHTPISSTEFTVAPQVPSTSGGTSSAS